MVKHFNVWMAGIISGIVALFTSYLGISGTIIGSVLSSFLYQFLSSYSAEKYDEGAIKSPNLANEIVYIFPLVVILIIELIFFLSALHYRFDMLFDVLESAVYNNLFRLMGIGLIILGAYPFFDSNNIHKNNGAVVLVLGVLLLLRGFVDITEFTAKAYYALFAEVDYLFAAFVVIALAVVIVNILIGSKNGDSNANNVIGGQGRKFGARKIDTSLGKKRHDVEEHIKGYVDGHRKVSNDGLENHGLDENDSTDYDNSFRDSTQDGSFSESNQDASFGDSTQDASFGNSNQEDSSLDNENLPLYEEEIILVNNPDDPSNPIRKRILKRIKRDNEDADSDDYQDMYIIDEGE